MKLYRYRFALVAALMATFYLFAGGAAYADTYANPGALVAKFVPGQVQVVADAAQTPPPHALTDPAGINAGILATHKPIYVAALAADQSGPGSLDAVHTALDARMGGHFVGVLLVIDRNGYHEGSYNVNFAVKPLMDAAAAAHHNDTNAAVAAFVSSVATQNFTPVGASTSGTIAAPHAATKSDHTVAWIVGGIIAFIVAMIAGILITSRLQERRARHLAQVRAVDAEIIRLDSELNDLDNAIVAGVEVANEQRQASVAMAEAKTAQSAGDLDEAAAHLRVVARQVDKANRKISPASTPRTEHDRDAIAAIPKAKLKESSVTATGPTGASVVINNTNYRTSPSSGYNHYYGGGYYNGMAFYPGYYPYNYWGAGWGWSPTDILMTDLLLEDRWGGNYNQGYVAGYDSASTADTSFDQPTSTFYEGDTGFNGPSDDSSTSGDTSFGNDSSGDTSFDAPTYSAPDPTPAYVPDAPTYDPPSYSSGDSGGYSGSGGGSDFSGGGSDF